MDIQELTSAIESQFQTVCSWEEQKDIPYSYDGKRYITFIFAAGTDESEKYPWIEGIVTQGFLASVQPYILQSTKSKLVWRMKPRLEVDDLANRPSIVARLLAI